LIPLGIHLVEVNALFECELKRLLGKGAFFGCPWKVFSRPLLGDESGRTLRGMVRLDQDFGRDAEATVEVATPPRKQNAARRLFAATGGISE
jgi:hypothetical protein